MVYVAQRRLPFDPLARLARCSTVSELAALFGVERQAIHRWRRNGVPLWAADRAALALNLHPMNVWGDAWLA